MKDDKKINQQTLVDVAVHPALREYLVSINHGSDILVPGRESRLWGLVKMHLELVPQDYKPTPVSGDGKSIRIALFQSKRKTYSYPTGSVCTVDTMFRDYLTQDGQRAVARHLMHGFKNTFRAYMMGSLSNNPELGMKEAIYEFCEDFHIENEILTVEMLRKDWYRFRKRSGEHESFCIETADL